MNNNFRKLWNYIGPLGRTVCRLAAILSLFIVPPIIASNITEYPVASAYFMGMAIGIIMGNWYTNWSHNDRQQRMNQDE